MSAADGGQMVPDLILDSPHPMFPGMTTREVAASMSARHVTETVVLQTYSLQIIGPDRGQELLTLKNALKWPEMMREAEENLSDLLPPNYEVRISEWDAEGDPHE